MKSILLVFCCFTFFSFQSDSVLTKNDLLGKLDPSKNESFVVIESEYTHKSGIFLRKETYTAFKRMYWEAHKCGIQLNIISATRNFNYQKGIWERKWSRSKYQGWNGIDKVKDILKYSSMPGTSRHHWGTDIDINALENSYFSQGEGLKVYDWLVSHGPEYGFHQTYTSKDSGRTGYEEEKWHWSYTPLSEKFLIEYNKQVDYSDLNGFKGSEWAQEVKAIDHYVLGIASDLLEN